MKPTILVTGATGSTGAQVVQQLRRQDWPVRALVRRVDVRAERLRTLGADVVMADLFDPGQLAAAMRGAYRAYYCPPTHPHMLAVQRVSLSPPRQRVSRPWWCSASGWPARRTRRS